MLTQFAKNVLASLGLTVVSSASDVRIYKYILGSRTYGLVMTTLTISKKEVVDIKKTFKYLGESGFMIQGSIKKIQNKIKGQRGRFLGISLGTVGVCLLRNALAGEAFV